MEIQIRNCNEHQLPEILDIFNDAILNSTALYEYKVRTMDMMNVWYTEKIKLGQPLIGAFDESNLLVGFATFGQFRQRPAYKYTVEHSVYVRHDKRGLGAGSILLKAIIAKAEEQNMHVMIGVIDASNTASIKLHENMGFILSGKINQVGYKFGKWLDAAFYQLILNTPEFPDEQ